MPSGGEKVKKSFTFTLNPESHQIVKTWLEANGQTFSGWMTAFLDEWAKEIQGQPSMMGKRTEDMTVKEFIDVMQYWLKKAHQATQE